MTAPGVPSWLKPADGLSMPAAYASRDDWEHYAVHRGMAAGMAAASSRDQLVLAFVPLDAPRDDTPRLERFDRDPETAAVRAAARRRPWEQALWPGGGGRSPSIRARPWRRRRQPPQRRPSAPRTS